MRRLLRRLTAPLRRARQERELLDELAAHVALDTEERIEAGETPDAAGRAARLDLGRVSLITEDTRTSWGWPGFEQLWADLRLAARSVRRHPAFTATSAVTLGLAIGATTAIASFVYFSVLRPLPFEHPDRIVRVYDARRRPIAPPTFLDWQARNQVFDRMAAFQPDPRTLQTRAGARQLAGMNVSADFLPLLGVRLLHGRQFRHEEDEPGGGRVVIVSHAFWNAQFDARPSAVGSVLSLDGQAHIVVGVLPAEFRFGPNEIDVWTPLQLGDNGIHRMSRDERYLGAIARLNEGTTLSHATTHLNALTKQIALEIGADPRPSPDVVPLHETLVGPLRTTLFVLLGGAMLVLLVACANVSNLFLARSLTRSREIALCSALGARRAHLIRQPLAEATLIGMLGGAVSVAVSTAGIGAALPLLDRIGGPYAFVVSRMPAGIMDWRVLLFSMAVCLALAVACGLGSAIRAAASTPTDLLHADRGVAGSRRHRRLHTALIVTEVSVTLILAVGAGLLLNSYVRVQRVDVGFEPGPLLTLRLHSFPEGAIDFYRRVIERVTTLPGVESATVTSSLPLLGVDTLTRFAIEGRAPASVGEELQAVYKVVGNDYFEVFRIALLSGRSFHRERAESEPVVIVNHALARVHFPGEIPVGRRIRQGQKRPWHTIVGVVRDVKVGGPETETPPEIYIPHSQFLLVPNSRSAMPNMNLVIRADGDPAPLLPSLRRSIRAIEASALITNEETMSAALSRIVAPRELSTSVIGCFAAIALVLALVGIYGVVSYSVAQRRHEMGIRSSLGAQRRSLLVLVLRQAMFPVSAGVVLGLIGAVALMRWTSALLFQVATTDPSTFGAVTVMVFAVSLAACYLPARRAVRTDPMTALRQQ